MLQAQFGAVTQCNLGLADGEQMERLWSYLRKFSSMTKQMAMENRVDTLSEALEHHSKKVVSKLRKSKDLIRCLYNNYSYMENI